jgi:predicted DNA-binding transcriptional regulator AlpA
MTARLLGLSAIARRLGVSRQRVHVLATRPDFPAPAHELDTGRVWREPDIERWVAAHPQYDHTAAAA